MRTVHRFGYAFSGKAQEALERPGGVGGRQVACWLLRGRRRIPLEAGETIIGRDPGAAVFLDDKSVYPDEATMRRLYTISAHDPKTQRLMNRLWTRIKTGK